MQHISKPHLVDLLRIFDRKRWLSPRIRYASVRSKPALIDDLQKHFKAIKRANRVRFLPRKQLLSVPTIEFDLKERQYYFDGKVVDVHHKSREKVRFSISRTPVTLEFFEFYPVSK